MIPPKPFLQVTRPGPGSAVTVVGLARSGAAAARWLCELGCRVRVTELAKSDAARQAAESLKALGALVELGGHSRDFIAGSKLVVTSPGVPPESRPLRWARDEGIPVVSELELASWYCPGRIVAVTGSNGKSTVTTLLGEILHQAGQEVVVAGNIGNPLSGELGRLTPKTVVVLEVSSFQLESSLSFHPEVACLLNLTPNHLDRHQSLGAYRAAKAKLFAHQSRRGCALLNADDEGSASFAREAAGTVFWFSRRRKVTGACLAGGWLFLNLPHLSGPICRRESLARRGPHHEENALAAAGLAGVLGVAPAVSGQVLQHFQGLAHRQEVIAVLRGVTFVNDSKATTVSAGIRAIEAAPSRVVLIAGGRDKGSDFAMLRPLREKIKAVVAIGEDGPKITRALRGFIPSHRSSTLQGAVQAAFGMAREGEWVLLSPMCTSFDMFRDYEERGAHFAEAVRELSNGCVP